jgi:adenylate kinase family enzyme
VQAKQRHRQSRARKLILRRVVILGGAGTGKSTLASKLGKQLGLPVVHLDLLYWRPGWREPDTESFRARVATAVAGDGWVSEGNYRQTFDLRLPRADTVIVLEAPRWLCLARALRRTFFSSLRIARPEGCPDRLDWGFLRFVWQFDRVTWPDIEAARVAYRPDVPAIRLRSKREIAAFLASQTKLAAP